LAAACLLAFPAALSAQTAEFSWVQSTVGNGFGSVSAVAVDGSGNVYIV
jgi:hypothetical protein